MYFEPRGCLPPRAARPYCSALPPPQTTARSRGFLLQAVLPRQAPIEAMMPFVSHAPLPQMYSSSSREGMNGGTVSMWVDSVTAGSPNAAYTFHRPGSTSVFSAVPLCFSQSCERTEYRYSPTFSSSGVTDGMSISFAGQLEYAHRFPFHPERVRTRRVMAEKKA